MKLKLGSAKSTVTNFAHGVAFAMTLAVSSASAQSIEVIYQPARTAALREIQADWQRQRTLDDSAAMLERSVNLQKPLRLVSAECGVVNAFYSKQHQAIVMCLELVPDLVDGAIKEFGRNGSAFQLLMIPNGAYLFLLFHELGHALIDQYQLPVLGREEDAADQISTYLLLRDHQLGEVGVHGALFFFRKKSFFFGQHHLSGEHGLAPQRRANIACWAYGKDQQRFAWALQVGGVTPQRAARCRSEYDQLERAAQALMGTLVR